MVIGRKVGSELHAQRGNAGDYAHIPPVQRSVPAQIARQRRRNPRPVTLRKPRPPRGVRGGGQKCDFAKVRGKAHAAGTIFGREIFFPLLLAAGNHSHAIGRGWNLRQRVNGDASRAFAVSRCADVAEKFGRGRASQSPCRVVGILFSKFSHPKTDEVIKWVLLHLSR